MDRLKALLDSLRESLEGDLKYDDITTAIYATDASVYKEFPLAVAWPKGASDIRKLLDFAAREKTSITMRAGGTSLAGQVVSSGIIVDVSRDMNRILEINPEEKWVRVEPGVVLDELNLRLREYGLFFGPETSTSNRCNIGGMAGNNACGSHSLVYGSTRDHTLEMKVILSDGSEATFGPADRETFDRKCSMQNLEGKIYRNIREILDNKLNRNEIRKGYPDPSIKRRNTGYALDLLLNSELFNGNSGHMFNFCNLLVGSEGTLAVTTEIRLNLVPLPPPVKALVCIHLKDRNEAFRANLVALKHGPVAVEMMDDRILGLTEDNLSQRNNRFFLTGNPGAIVIVEFARESREEIDEVTSALIAELRSAGYGYAYPVIRGKDISKVWDLRKAGLGILANMKGDPKPVAVIEDTAINVEQFPAYISDIEAMLASHGKDAVFHAHIGTGELHLRPVLNLKNPGDTELFREIGLETARIVKKYNGSLSGEHGDGRLRGEFIPLILGEHNYSLLRKIKNCWDPHGILNPGKITDTPAMNSSLRYIPGTATREIATYYDFSSSDGILRAAERCNGSADCRKSIKIGGVMCPSFMATGDEALTTRARANLVREYLNRGDDPWDHREIHQILDLCLACKGCKSECPSGVDMAKIKSEFLQHWNDKHGISLRSRLVAEIPAINRIGSLLPGIFNFFFTNRMISGFIKKIAGFASERSIPAIRKTTLRKWSDRNLKYLNPKNPVREVCLFIDEFTDYNDTEAGIAAIRLLTALNYKVVTAKHGISARTYISKGLIRKAQKTIRGNLNVLSAIVSDERPLIGIEPSAILGFRDEYPDLCGKELKETAIRISRCSFMLDEFIAAEFRAGAIDRGLFTPEIREVIFHAHCQQKAVSGSSCTLEMLSIPINYSVREIPSGCCGMAGAFGYEREHFELSNMIGELALFPAVRGCGNDTILAAPGTSCRHHIKDGTGRKALHPAEILYEALRTKTSTGR